MNSDSCKHNKKKLECIIRMFRFLNLLAFIAPNKFTTCPSDKVKISLKDDILKDSWKDKNAYFATD